MHDTNVFQHCRLLRGSTTQHSLVSSNYQESAAVWANIYIKQWKSYQREQSSGNGRQPWKRNDYQAVNECDKEVPALFRLFGYCGYLQVSKGCNQHRPKQLWECPEPSHLNRLPLHNRHCHWPSPPLCCALRITWHLLGQTARLTDTVLFQWLTLPLTHLVSSKLYKNLTQVIGDYSNSIWVQNSHSNLD